MQRQDEFGTFSKQIILASLTGDSYDFEQDDTEYTLTISYFALGWFDLILNFAFDLPIFIGLFVFMGGMTVGVCYLFWMVCRLCTPAEPTSHEAVAYPGITGTPAVTGVFLAIIPVWILTSIGNMIINALL